ncbi:MAG: hypothetical protein HYX71_07730 [Opitutae bacterium]|nr:hypothetical protein [Opitutae bacterium]
MLSYRVILSCAKDPHLRQPLDEDVATLGNFALLRMTDGENKVRTRWAGAGPDALAFAGGLGLAWHFQWETRDLVWSLWLSSLVIGYGMIVWSLIGPAILIGAKAWGERALLRGEPKGPMALAGGAMLVGGLFLLAFFTVHFGGFHFVHSVFLNTFFPVEPGLTKSFPGPALYWEVFRRYWWFLPAAAIAERQAFRLAPAPAGPPDTAVTAEAIAARKARNARVGLGGGGTMAPYRNVVRLHLLIFFFAGAHLAKLDNFLVYAVVSAVYFFPWRLLRRAAAVPAASG